MAAPTRIFMPPFDAARPAPTTPDFFEERAGLYLGISERERAVQAPRDALTGLLDRDAIVAHLDRLLADPHGGRQAHCLLLCGVDRFDEIVARLGQRAGDEALRHCADRLRLQLRGIDQIGRYGATEFLVVLVDTDVDAASAIAERLRHAVHDDPSDEPAPLQVTVSIGLAQRRAHEERPACLERAARCLADARQAGRDRIVADARRPSPG
jgi:diguanylate cyclase (GGDEF)-like protein